MKIAILNQKGGVGKTTATLLLAYAIGEAGKHVGLIDRDPQQSAKRWLGDAPGTNVEMARPGGSYDYVLIDTPGNSRDPAFVQTVMEADRVILPCRLSSVDIYSTQQAAEFVRVKRPKLRPAILFCQVISGTRMANSREDFAKALGLRTFKNVIPQRQSFVYAAHDGYEALRPADRQTLSHLAIEIISLKP